MFNGEFGILNVGETAGLVVHLHAFELAEEIEGEFDAVGEFDFILRGGLFNFDNLDVRTILLDVGANGTRHDCFRDGSGFAVDRRPFAGVGEFDCRAVDEAHVVVGLAQEVFVGFHHSDFCLREVFE